MLDASSTAMDTVRIMNGVVGSLQVKKARMLKASATSYAISLDIAEQLVARGLPFRTAHKLVGVLVSKATEKDVPLSGAKEVGLVLSHAKPGKSLSEAEVVRIIRDMTPARSIELRTSAGSPNPKQQDDMIKSVRLKLARYEKRTQENAKSVKAAFSCLSGTVARYLDS